jgi:hypothetical protein
MARQITFEIDEEIWGHFDSLVVNWNKDPEWLARRLFEEEVLAAVAGSRGVPLLRKYLYRDQDVYFSPEELILRQHEIDRNLDPVEEAERRSHVDELFAKMKSKRELPL